MRSEIWVVLKKNDGIGSDRSYIESTTVHAVQAYRDREQALAAAQNINSTPPLEGHPPVGVAWVEAVPLEA